MEEIQCTGCGAALTEETVCEIHGMDGGHCTMCCGGQQV